MDSLNYESDSDTKSIMSDFSVISDGKSPDNEQVESSRQSPGSEQHEGDKSGPEEYQDPVCSSSTVLPWADEKAAAEKDQFIATWVGRLTAMRDTIHGVFDPEDPDEFESMRSSLFEQLKDAVTIAGLNAAFENTIQRLTEEVKLKEEKVFLMTESHRQSLENFFGEVRRLSAGKDSEIDDLRKKLSMEMARQEGLKESLISVNKRAKSLAEDHKRRETMSQLEFTKLKAELQYKRGLECDLQTQKKKSTDCEKQLEALMVQLTTMRAEFLRIANNLKAQNMEFRKKTDELEADNNRILSNFEALKSKYEKLVQEDEALKLQVQESTAEVANSAKALQEKTDELEESNRLLAEETALHKTYLQNGIDYKAQVEAYQVHVNEIIWEKDNCIARQRENAIKCQEVVTELETQLLDDEKRMDKLENQYLSDQKKISQFRAQQAESEAIKVRLEVALDFKITIIKQLQTDLFTVKDRLSTVDKVNVHLQENNTSLKSIQKGLQAENDSLKSTQTKQQAEIAAANAKRAMIERQNELMRMQMAKLQEEQRKMEYLNRQLIEKKITKPMDEEMLKQKIETLESGFESQAAVIAAMHEKAKEADAQSRSQRQKINDLSLEKNTQQYLIFKLKKIADEGAMAKKDLESQLLVEQELANKKASQLVEEKRVLQERVDKLQEFKEKLAGRGMLRADKSSVGESTQVEAEDTHMVSDSPKTVDFDTFHY